MTTSLDCRTERRRDRVRESALFGLDYLEIGADQRTLAVHFLGRAPYGLGRGSLRIEGGERIRDVAVTDVEVFYSADPELDDWMRVSVDQAGDFSTYVLRVVEADAHGSPTRRPRRDFDRRYDALQFSFKIGCASPLDWSTPTSRKTMNTPNILARVTT